MSELEELLNQIEELRLNMYTLYEKNKILTDHKMVVASQLLDVALNKYDVFMSIYKAGV
ncbi:aspartyl-phosphate phosphatase Spo0E family protein [Dehalobacter sp. DCM]|uniref:aspartyl-phosphate phosphatase Spo0E family protein n=1 Tax=Dehalobacter sp. DCM TaxID=2907827 RepID=UPI003081C84F|nr:aspartyl-phosphate phosphatase Spo0E family protein [Dehalobacter sp. DCM]